MPERQDVAHRRRAAVAGRRHESRSGAPGTVSAAETSPDRGGLGRTSDLRLATVDKELGAIDEARLLGRQKQHHVGDLFGLADTSKGDA